MKRPIVGSVVVFAASAAALCLAAYAGEVREFAAQYVNGEQATTLDPSSGGQPIYQGTVSVPADVDILEVTISATGDLLNGGTPVPNSLWLNCQVDGNNCNSGSNSAVNSVAGWVPVLSLNSSAQIPEASATPAVGTDNNIHYSWCVPIKKKKGPNGLSHSVQLSMASGDGADTVHIEQVQVRVGGANIGGPNNANACTSAPAPTPVL
jgi:hypothetical protein